MTPLANLESKILINQIGSLNRSIAELEETIGQEGRKLERHKNLTSIKGIGRLSAAIVLSIIDDIGDFFDEGRLAAYLRSYQESANSNETNTAAGLPNADQAGPNHARAVHPDRTALQSPLECLLRKKKSRGTGKAIIALARKFPGIIYRRLKNKWLFEDGPNFVLAEAATV